jgi:NitT/TauT family transport system permease protein
MMIKKVLISIVFILCLVGLWQLIVFLQIWPDYVLPSPLTVMATLAKNLENGHILQAIAISLKRIAIGYSASILLGFLIGISCGGISLIDDTIGTLVLGFQSLPSIAWLPLAVLWFGLNDKAVIFVVLIGSVFSMAISVRLGIKSVPNLLRQVGMTFGATRFQMYRHIILPSIVPSTVQGLKLGWSFAWRSLMAGELLVAGLGLGQMLTMGRDLNDMSLVMSVMLVIVAIGLVVDRVIFARLESWVKERWV